jgi:hypothetical protein
MENFFVVSFFAALVSMTTLPFTNPTTDICCTAKR